MDSPKPLQVEQVETKLFAKEDNGLTETDHKVENDIAGSDDAKSKDASDTDLNQDTLIENDTSTGPLNICVLASQDTIMQEVMDSPNPAENVDLDADLDQSNLSVNQEEVNTSVATNDVVDWRIPADISKNIDDGPAQPRMNSFPKTVFGVGRHARSFCANWYERFPWLEYSVITDRAYCFACRHFGKEEEAKKRSIYTSTGFCKWCKAHDRLQRHNNSAKHLAAMAPWLEDTLKREKDEALNNSSPGKLSTNGVGSVKRSASNDPPVWKPRTSKRRKQSQTLKVALTPQHGHNEDMSWCKCTNCKSMSTAEKCVCCCEVPTIRNRMKDIRPSLKCITDHPGFSAICLNHWVLQVAYYQQRLSVGELSVSEDYERYRYVAYCQFVRWCWGYLEEDMQVPLPSCVVSSIKTVFHASSNSVHPSLALPNAEEDVATAENE